MTETTALEDFAACLAAAPPLDDSDRTEARLSLLDTAACMAAGARTPVARRALAGVDRSGEGGPCRAFGAGGLSPGVAAFFYALAAHCEDFDDSELVASTHPSAVLIAALLALSESRPTTYENLGGAYTAGLAAIVHVGRALGYGHYRRGWHATATLGPIGAACACARLMGLDVCGLVAAMSLATSRAAGMTLQFGSDAKAVQAGFAAQAGLQAALLAESGMTASPAVWDGPGGLLDLYGDGAAHGFIPASPETLSLASGLIARKAYPCCQYTHRAIAAALSLDVSGDEIVSGVVSLPLPFAQVVAVEQPATPDEARFSVVYCVAIALADGRVDAASFSDSAPGRADLRAISSRLRLEPYSVPSQIADLSPEYADSVTVRTRDGRELRSEQANVPGGPESPLSVETLIEKACACFASGGVPKQSRRALCEALLHGPERRSVELLVAATDRK